MPSPSKSPTLTKVGWAPVANVTPAANETEVIEPVTAVFLKTEMELAAKLLTIISGFPSPSMSANSTPLGLPPVAKSTLASSELAVMVPGVAELRNTETLLPELLETAISVLPSPSISFIAI